MSNQGLFRKLNKLQEPFFHKISFFLLEIISAIGETARQQIVWEFENLKSAKVVLFWFPNAETIITFLELGKELARKSRIVVGVDPDYNRRFDIETQVHLELPRAVIYTTLDETVQAAARLCGKV